MVMMKYFCFYFPVRLGVLITSGMNFIESLGFLGAVLMHDSKFIKEHCENVLEHIDDYSTNDVFEKTLKMIIDYHEEYFLFLVVFTASCGVSCVLNVLAALKMWRWFSVPYILLIGARLAIALAIYILGMMVYKKQWNLGVLIAACCGGGFVFLYLGYMWACTIAMFEILGIVKSPEYQKAILLGSPPPLQRNVTVASLQIKQSTTDLNADNRMLISDFSQFSRQPPPYYRF